MSFPVEHWQDHYELQRVTVTEDINGLYQELDQIQQEIDLTTSSASYNDTIHVLL